MYWDALIALDALAELGCGRLLGALHEDQIETGDGVAVYGSHHSTATSA